jgi:hypothetical protein
MRFRLRELDPIRVYGVMAGEQSLATLTGRQLMDEGLVVEVPARYEAQILVVAPA